VVTRTREVGGMNVEAFAGEVGEEDGLEGGVLTAPVYGIVA